MDWRNRDGAWIGGLGVAAFVFVVYLFAVNLQPEWKDYQAEFRDLVAERFGEARARQVQTGIQQVYIRELNRADRCVTCHLGMEWQGLERADQPYRSHPKQILAKHPLAKYGCTICHGGQGSATTTDDAHGVILEHWESPLLGQELARAYTVSDREALLQSNCNVCHRYDRETSGADYINYAKELVRAKGCRACHTINGRGGVIGPNLDYVGDLSPEQYDYSRLSGKPSTFSWHVAHFKTPKTTSSESIMPNFNFGSREAQALALLALSWKKARLPVEYLPGVRMADNPTPEEIEKEQRMSTGPGAAFVKKGCFVCHDVSSLGIESAAKIGPDLAQAYTDVQSRFGRTLEDFLLNPTGTMSVVLATQIQLTREERLQFVETLKAAFQKRQELEAKQSKPGK